MLPAESRLKPAAILTLCVGNSVIKKVLLASAVVAIASTSVFAADLPARTAPYTKAPFVPVMYDWSGLYIGLNAGGASSHECFTITRVAGAAVNPNSEGCHNATGALVGGQIGYRWQMTNWVFGLEAQGDWANLKGSTASLTALPAVPYNNQTKIDAIGLFTGQVGYAWNNVLWYVKGGAAVSDNSYTSFFTTNGGGFPAGTVFNQASETRWGGAVGTGVEVGFAPNWSVAFEYDHLFMGSNNMTFPPSAIAVTRGDNIRQDVDMGMVRVNYRFGGPVIAKY
jgi:outer membrane immunogenic protein